MEIDLNEGVFASSMNKKLPKVFRFMYGEPGKVLTEQVATRVEMEHGLVP